MSAPVRGMLDLEALRREVGEGRIETIITALPDLYGRLVSPRPVSERDGFALVDLVAVASCAEAQSA